MTDNKAMIAIFYEDYITQEAASSKIAGFCSVVKVLRSLLIAQILAGICNKCELMRIMEEDAKT